MEKKIFKLVLSKYKLIYSIYQTNLTCTAMWTQ